MAPLVGEQPWIFWRGRSFLWTWHLPHEFSISSQYYYHVDPGFNSNLAKMLWASLGHTKQLLFSYGQNSQWWVKLLLKFWVLPPLDFIAFCSQLMLSDLAKKTRFSTGQTVVSYLWIWYSSYLISFNIMLVFVFQFEKVIFTDWKMGGWGDRWVVKCLLYKELTSTPQAHVEKPDMVGYTCDHSAGSQSHMGSLAGQIA